MCGPTATFQGKIAAIDILNPGVSISGLDTANPTLRHTLIFTNTAECKGSSGGSLKRYRFSPSEYQPVLDWLMAGGKIKLFGEPVLPPATPLELKPAGWQGVGL